MLAGVRAESVQVFRVVSDAGQFGAFLVGRG
jgi:hypothetical protein